MTHPAWFWANQCAFSPLFCILSGEATNINFIVSGLTTLVLQPTIYCTCGKKKSLKIQKEQSESVHWRRTDKTMTKEKVQKDKQRSTKHTHKTKDRVTWTPLKTGGELSCSGRVSNSCSTSGTRRVNLVTKPVISREWGKDREVITTSGTYPWSFVTH